MKTSKLRGATAIGALAALLSACGGNVNLGGKGSEANGAAGAAQAPDQTVPPAGERVLESSDLSLFELVVAGDYLYLVGASSTESGIFRCRKSDCEATFGLFFSGSARQIQAFGDRLGFTRWQEDSLDITIRYSYGFASVAFSDAKDEHVVIRALPGDYFLPALFYENFVFFSLVNDRAMYRCSLPACADNPERLAGAKGRGDFTPRADADRLIWSDRRFIYRAGDYGSEPAIALLPDDSLSVAPATVWSSDEPRDQISAMDAGNGMLYASLARSPEAQPCDEVDCPHEVMAWPVLGGAARHLFTSERPLTNLRVFGDELVWTSQSVEQWRYDAATVSTCRIEACDATRRDLGESRGGMSVIAADEQDIYWIELDPTTGPISSDTWLQRNQIRRAPRLPAP